MIDYGFGVRLAPLDSQHGEAIRSWRNDCQIWQWCRQYSLITDISQKKWLEKINDDSSSKMFVIEMKDKSRELVIRYACTDKNHSPYVPVGVCGLTSIDLISRRAEFSLYIGPDFQRKGYARAALMTLFKHGFMDFGLNCIWGETFEGNPALKLFLSLGMKQEGVRRQFYFKNGKFIDAHLISILRDEWNPHSGCY